MEVWRVENILPFILPHLFKTVDILQQGFLGDDNNENNNAKETPKGDLQKEVAEMLTLNTLLHGGGVDDVGDSAAVVEDEKNTQFEGLCIIEISSQKKKNFR